MNAKNILNEYKQQFKQSAFKIYDRPIYKLEKQEIRFLLIYNYQFLPRYGLSEKGFRRVFNILFENEIKQTDNVYMNGSGPIGNVATIYPEIWPFFKANVDKGYKEKSLTRMQRNLLMMKLAKMYDMDPDDIRLIVITDINTRLYGSEKSKGKYKIGDIFMMPARVNRPRKKIRPSFRVSAIDPEIIGKEMLESSLNRYEIAEKYNITVEDVDRGWSYYRINNPEKIREKGIERGKHVKTKFQSLAYTENAFVLITVPHAYGKVVYDKTAEYHANKLFKRFLYYGIKCAIIVGYYDRIDNTDLNREESEFTVFHQKIDKVILEQNDKRIYIIDCHSGDFLNSHHPTVVYDYKRKFDDELIKIFQKHLELGINDLVEGKTYNYIVNKAHMSKIHAVLIEFNENPNIKKIDDIYKRIVQSIIHHSILVEKRLEKSKEK